ncbi:hypothetical protein [Nocardioides kribbensis]|uniref:hypothetical protein n=1 Tax=Nocardioides kribbensis TaxID=305517 RepID=UPI00187AEA62|nr:hypothetical protein [Nocardioides kribbensis]
MSECRCLFCNGEVTNGLALCPTCQQTATVALVNVAAFHADVLRIKPGERVKVRGAYQSTPPPALESSADRISEAADWVSSIVFGWVRNLEDDRPGIDPAPLDTGKRCAWLERHLSSIATLEWAGEMLTEMLDCERRLQRILDRSDTGWYAGVCGNELGRQVMDDGEVDAVYCPRGLYGSQGTKWVRCPECGRTWDAGQRRDVMIAEAREEVAPVRVIARIAVGLIDGEMSEERLTKRIERWIDREKLLDVGVRVLDGRPRRVYKLGEVFDLLQPKQATDEPAA